LRFDFLERGGATQTGNVAVNTRLTLALSPFAGRGKYLLELRFGFVAAEGEVECFAAIEADEVGKESNLRG
jgi:hypothetical protein